MRSNYFCILCEFLPTKCSRPSLDFPRREYSVRATGISYSQSAKHVVNCAILSFVRFIFPLMFPHYSYSALSTYCVPSVSEERKKTTLVVSRCFNPLPRSYVLVTKAPTGRQADATTSLAAARVAFNKNVKRVLEFNIRTRVFLRITHGKI